MFWELSFSSPLPDTPVGFAPKKFQEMRKTVVWVVSGWCNPSEGHIWEALRCPFANYVLQKCVTVTDDVTLFFFGGKSKGYDGMKWS